MVDLPHDQPVLEVSSYHKINKPRRIGILYKISNGRINQYYPCKHQFILLMFFPMLAIPFLFIVTMFSGIETVEGLMSPIAKFSIYCFGVILITILFVCASSPKCRDCHNEACGRICLHNYP